MRRLPEAEWSMCSFLEDNQSMFHISKADQSTQKFILTIFYIITINIKKSQNRYDYHDRPFWFVPIKSTDILIRGFVIYFNFTILLNNNVPKLSSTRSFTNENWMILFSNLPDPYVT